MLGKTESKGKRGQQRMRWTDGITDLMDMKGMEAWRAAVHGSQKVGHDLVTEQ